MQHIIAIVLCCGISASVADVLLPPSENITAFINNGFISGLQPHNVHVMGFRNPTGPNDPSAMFGGGSIVSARHVITAAHVLHGFGNYQIGYGSNQLMQLAVAYPATALIYPGFVPATRQHDIAILALRAGTAWTLPATTRPIRWAANSVDPMAGRVVTVVGFGFTFANEGFPSMQLRSAQLQVAAPGACQAAVSVTGSHFCGMPQAGRNVCGGDGGTGVFANDASGPVLLGIASTIPGGCNGLFGAGFTRVALYHTWIQNNLR